MNLQAKVTQHETGVYLHVPFCATTCDFCNFYQRKPHGDDFGVFLEGIQSEIGRLPPRLPVGTVFWGGGTPGLLGPREMETIGNRLRGACAAPPREWTVEMAPAFVTRRKLRTLRRLGVNRLSLGVQSFSEPLLEQLGRRHTVGQVRRAIDLVREEGFANFNIDLIFAIPGQAMAELEADLEQATAAAPAHISTYCLTFEEDTALFVKLSEGKVAVDPEREADFYLFAWRYLEDRGFPQYEVSNFARPGHESIHNINTWRMGEWIGLGPSAASQAGGRRYRNPASLEQWAAGLRDGRPVREEEMELSRETLAADALVFGIRMNRGVDLARWGERFALDPRVLDPLRSDWEQAGWAAPGAGETLRLTDRGRLLADRLGTEIMVFLERAIPLAAPPTAVP